jgi:predicted dehydrogenase
MPSPDADAARVVVVGYGLAGRVFHAPLIAATAGLRLAAVVTSSPERAAQARADHDGVAVLGSADEAIGGGFDLVVVATPNSSHVELARSALAAGAAVVVDKPLATDAAAARALLAESRGRLTVFQNRRWDGDFLTVRRLVDAGVLGRVTRFESRFDRWRPQVTDRWRDRGDPALGGGLLLDLGSHLVDQALCLLGPARRVYAEVDRTRAGALADDDVFVAIEHVAGARSHLWASALAGEPGDRFRVLGDAAAYVKRGLDSQEAALRAGARPEPGRPWGIEDHTTWGRLVAGERAEQVPTDPGDYPAFYAAVAAWVAGAAEPPVDPADAVATAEVLDAARVAAAEHRVVEVAARESSGRAGVRPTAPFRATLEEER